MSPLEPLFSCSPSREPAPELDCSPGQKGATARFWTAAAAGLCLVGLLASFLLPAFARINVGRGRSNTQNNMKVMGLVLKMYAKESKGNCWPTLAANPRIWSPDLSVLCPEYLTDPSVLVAREHPDAKHIRASLHALLAGPNPDYDTASGLMALSFAYLGYAVKDEAGFRTLVEARKQGLIDGEEKTYRCPVTRAWLTRFATALSDFLSRTSTAPPHRVLRIAYRYLWKPGSGKARAIQASFPVHTSSSWMAT